MPAGHGGSRTGRAGPAGAHGMVVFDSAWMPGWAEKSLGSTIRCTVGKTGYMNARSG